MLRLLIAFFTITIGFSHVKGQTFCIVTHCGWETTQCVLDPKCWEVLTCLQDCQGQPDEAGCSFECGMEDADENFQNLVKCMVDNDCMAKYEDDGICMAEDSDALQEITDISQVQGDWWVLKGQNCGQDEIWRGGYDWYPCQHGRFETVEEGDWINNTTYCNGKDSQCTSEIIVTIPKLSLISPGVVRHNYPQGQAPIVPQVEDWKFVAFPDPDWALVIWCGHNPVLQYNGAFVVSRKQNMDNLTEEIDQELRSAAEKFGIDYDAMCISDNTSCEP